MMDGETRDQFDMSPRDPSSEASGDVLGVVLQWPKFHKYHADDHLRYRRPYLHKEKRAIILLII